MPRVSEMTWEGKPYYRWVKMYKGIRYRVSCESLKAMILTEEATRKKANEWWRRKQAELDGHLFKGTEKTIEHFSGKPPETTLDYLRGIKTIGEKFLEQGGERFADKSLELLAAEAKGAEPGAIINLATALDAALEVTATPLHQQLGQQVKRFLEVLRTQIQPMSYREIDDWLRTIQNIPGLSFPEMEVGTWNEDFIRKMYLFVCSLDLSLGAKKKRWGFFKRFARHLWEERLIELPRNLDKRDFAFKVVTKKVKVYPLAEVQAFLASVKPYFQMYALLGLNCGCTNADIGQLTKDQVDWEKGTLTRKRVKTASHDAVPEVVYPLWPKTFSLLKEFQSKHETLLLTSVRNTPLYATWFEGEKEKKVDLLSKQWVRNKLSIPLKAFRSISATLLKSNAIHGQLVGQFLGHSPKSMADKHYAAPPQELFNSAIGWLGSHFE